MGLSHTVIHLWTFRVLPDFSPLAAVAWLDAAELERMYRFHHPVDQVRYGFFHMVQRQRLASVLPGSPAPSELRFGVGEFGKPFLADWPEVHLNLTHSKDQAVLAATLAGPVGVDVEMLDDQFPALEIAREYFVGEERAAIEGAATPKERTHRFFQLWTAKEAVMKVTGLGMGLEPRSIELKLEAGSQRPVGFHAVAGFPRAAWDWHLFTGGLGGAVFSLVGPAQVTERPLMEEIC